MSKFYVTAKVREINKYEFTVEANSPEEAEEKLKRYLQDNQPYVFGGSSVLGVMCDDRESGVETEEIVSVTAG